MRNISGTYEIGLVEKKFNAEIPSSWEELSPVQFARIIQVLHYKKADKFTVAASLLSLLFGRNNYHILHNLPKEYLVDLAPLTNFIQEETPPLKNYFQVINIRKKEHHAPEFDLSNLKFGEWCFAHQFYSYYNLTKDITWLNKLIAVLYRPADPDQDPESPKFSGDIREDFNDFLFEKRSLSVGQIPEHIRLAILTWFSLALHQVQKTRKNVFPETEEAEDPEEIKNPDSRTWLTVFRELLGPKFGTTEVLKNTNALFVLDELEDRHIAYKEAMKSTT